MKSVLPRNFTLEDVLAADHVGEIYDAREMAIKKYDLENTLTLSAYEKMNDVRDKLYSQDDDLKKNIQQCSWETVEGRVAIAALLGLPLETIDNAHQYVTGFMDAYTTSVSDQMLLRSWRALKYRANIPDVGPGNFPTVLTKPFLVLYSADWCPPCRVIRPTFARLRRFFDKADVGYCHNEEWRKSKGIDFIPQFVAYFPGGAEVHSHVPDNTREIWETMNNLVVLGQSFQGKGNLVCTDDSCTIVPAAKQE